MSNPLIAVLGKSLTKGGVSKRLAEHFGAQRVVCLSNPKERLFYNSFVLNFGRSQRPVWYDDALDRGIKFINDFAAVGLSANKVETFRALNSAGVPTLDWSTNTAFVDAEWLKKGHKALARHTTTGNSGEGIELCDGTTISLNAPLYTKYYDKTHEFRVSVVDGRVIDYTQKKSMGSIKLDKIGIDEVDNLVRSYKRGWVFCRNDIVDSPLVRELGIRACAALGLDFGGIDILAKVKDGKVTDAVVCETNTAPGIRGVTATKRYTDAFQRFIEDN